MTCQFSIRLAVLLFVALFLILPKSATADDVPTSDSYASLVADGDAAVTNQDYSTAFNDYLHASQLDASQPAALSSALTVLEQNTPTTINLPAVSRMPAEVLPFVVNITNTEAATSHTDYKTVIIVPTDALSTEQDDPVESWPFTRAIYVYSSIDGVKANLICTVHYQSADYTQFAQKTGALLALLDDVYNTKMVVARADDSYPFHVWLCSTAPVSNGGEQWRNNIYFYDIGDERSSIEWIREIAHEFSHLAFQAVGGDYTYPEAFANGYLGERLLVRWLSRGVAGGGQSVEADWLGTFAGYPNFERLLITPSLAEFTAHGLNKTELARRDEVGMRYMIGMMLYVDDVCGSQTVGNILQSVADQHSTDPNLLYDPVKLALAAAKHKKAH